MVNAALGRDDAHILTKRINGEQNRTCINDKPTSSSDAEQKGKRGHNQKKHNAECKTQAAIGFSSTLE
ncbi:uncharacterized protein G2W53_005886 [Senna tora]|uniref:Uncharacterized protein n=1 Tax=Senna tora TaxID=362788 RepID=A0A835CCA5_9FABA|nr:uncharacterized protein G2W53_005886 [Senna tora]